MTTAEEAIERFARAGLDEKVRLFEEAYGRTIAFVREAASSTRPPREDWRVAITETVEAIDQLARRDEGPDSVMWAQSAMAALSRIWLDTEATEALSLGVATETN